MRIAIIGAGAVGGFTGARLAAAGHDVAFLARGASLLSLRRDGIRLRSPTGDVRCTVRAEDRIAALGNADTVVVAVKSWQVAELARPLAALAGEETVFLTLQNGVEAPERLAAGVPAQQILAGVYILTARAVGPGEIRHVGARPSVQLGPLQPMTDGLAARTDELCGALEDAGITCARAPDIDVALWRKLMLITSYGGVGALARAPVGITRQLAPARALIERAMREVLAVANARDVALTPDDVAAMMAQVDAFDASSTASMQRDIAAGRPSELDDQSGAVLRLGAQAGVATPTHEVIHGALLALEQRARGEIAF